MIDPINNGKIIFSERLAETSDSVNIAFKPIAGIINAMIQSYWKVRPRSFNTSN